MKSIRVKSIFGIAIFILLSIAILFYFWAGSGFYEKDKYYQLTSNLTANKIHSDTLKVCSFNVGYFSGMTNNKSVEKSEELYRGNLLKFIDFFSAESVDIFAFQEIDFGASRSYEVDQLKVLSDSLLMPSIASAVNWDKSYVPFPYWPIKYQFGKMLSGQAILSKMQILDQKVEVLSKPIHAPFYYNKFYLDRLVQTAYFPLNDEDTLALMNVHLEAFDQETRLLQTERVAELFQQLRKKYIVILLGDFNSGPPFGSTTAGSTLRAIFEIDNLGSVVNEKAYVNDPSKYYTFDSHKPEIRLDYIFYDATMITMVDSGVFSEIGEVSDHLPVWMSFTLLD